MDRDMVYTILAVAVFFLILWKVGNYVNKDWKFYDLRYKQNQKKKADHPEYRWYMYET